MHRQAIHRRRAYLLLSEQPLPGALAERRVLPPEAQLAGLHQALDDARVVALRRGEEILAINRGEHVVVAHVPIVRAREQVRHARGRGERVRRDRVRDGADRLDGECARHWREREGERGPAPVRGGQRAPVRRG